MGGFLSLVFGSFPLLIMRQWSLVSYSASKHISDPGNQHDNYLDHDQIFDNPAALCLGLWINNLMGVGEGEGG